jgi:hypothetical protein
MGDAMSALAAHFTWSGARREAACKVIVITNYRDPFCMSSMRT